MSLAVRDCSESPARLKLAISWHAMAGWGVGLEAR